MSLLEETSALDKGHRIGNFHKYYEFNPPSNRLDVLKQSGLLEYIIATLRSSASVLDDKDVNTTRNMHLAPTQSKKLAYCDLGCNEGNLTLTISRELGRACIGNGTSVHSLGLDVDKELIRRATEKSERFLVQEEYPQLEKEYIMDATFQVCNLIDEDDHLATSREFLKTIGRDHFDLISIFSTTMWIHIQAGDDGLISFLRRVCSLTKLILIEPQPSKCYGRVNARLRKMNRPEEDISVERLKLRNNIEDEIEKILRECNFIRVEVSSPSEGFKPRTKWQRNLELYRHLDSK